MVIWLGVSPGDPRALTLEQTLQRFRLRLAHGRQLLDRGLLLYFHPALQFRLQIGRILGGPLADALNNVVGRGARMPERLVELVEGSFLPDGAERLERFGPAA